MPVSNAIVRDQIEKRFDNVIKSPNDNRAYRGLTLKNKMKVMLVSDPTTDKSAACMNVNIGYFSDPDDLPGLAHFCEHMLFLGTEKYPQHNDYYLYLSENGGVSNAVTNMDRTSYYFNVDPRKLREALDRFAQFFISPLFTEEFTDLELKAIDSEHAQNMANDTWRIDQVTKSAADPTHPYSKFGTGSRQTLEKVPKEKGINVRERLFEFYNSYYSANLMSLSILGKESLDELEQMVIDLFSGIQNKEVKAPRWDRHPFGEEHFQTRWFVIPIKDTKILKISFEIPDLSEHYKSTPGHYVAQLIGHEGEGSLLSALKAKGWCNYLVSIHGAAVRGFSFFNVIVDLTEEGIEQVDNVILLVFQYINMLKREGPAEWFYNEDKAIADMNFRFKEKYSPSKYVTHIADIMHDYPIEETLTIGYLFSHWNPELINSLMEYLTPKKIRVLVIGKKFEDDCNESEKWYGTKFKKEKIPAETIEKWSNAGYNSSLKLPSKNEFIATKFDLKPVDSTITKYPEIVEDTPLIRLWFKQDDEYLVPKANLIFDFVSPIVYMDPVHYNVFNVFVLLFRDAMGEYSYAADLAQLRWDLNISKYGIQLGITGYDEKQRILLEKMMDKLVNFEVDPKRFEIFKDNYYKMLENFAAQQPFKHAEYYLTCLLSERAWSKSELIKATSHLTFERMQQYIPKFLSKVHVEAFIHGNVTMTEAIEMAKMVESKLINSIPHPTPLLPWHLILDRHVRLEDGCSFLYEAENTAHRNSCVKVYYQAGLELTETTMLLELLNQILAEPCFSTLRTKEQLGYVVNSAVESMNGVLGFRILVQGEKHPQYVEQRINAFLDHMLECVSNMSTEEFERHKESLAVQRLEKPKTLNGRSICYWNEIALQQYNFDRVNIGVSFLKTITQDQLLKFFKEIIFSEARRKLAVHIISTAAESGHTAIENETESSEETKVDESELKNVNKIDDILTFKLSQLLFPILKPYNDIPRKGIQSSKL